MGRGRGLRFGGGGGKKWGRMAGRLAWLAPQPPRDHAPGEPLGQVEEGAWRPLDICVRSGARGNKADRAMSKGLRLAAKPPAGVPRRSSLTLWSLEGEQEFRRSRHRALQHRAFRQKGRFSRMLCACAHGPDTKERRAPVRHIGIIDCHTRNN